MQLGLFIEFMDPVLPLIKKYTELAEAVLVAVSR